MDPILSHLIAFFGAVAIPFISTTVGGGGLLSIPLLMFLGLPAPLAVGTNILGAFGISIAGLKAFTEGKKVNYTIGIPIAMLAGVGSVAGSLTLLQLPEAPLKQLMAVLLIVILLFVLAVPSLGVTPPQRTSQTKRVIGYALQLFVGFWAAFITAGFSVFSSIILIVFFGQTFLESAGTRKLTGLVTSTVALVTYGIYGNIAWSYGLVYLVGMSIGSYLGAHYGMKQGNAWVRSLFILLVLLSAIGLLTN